MSITSGWQQQKLFTWLRWRQFRHASRLFMSHSALRAVSILISCLIVIGFVFVISYLGFNFLRHDIKLPLAGGIIGTIIDMLFITLGALLIFSSGLMLYGSLFNSAETAFLMSRPLGDDQVFAYKFQSALGFSSWAFLLLGGPILVAYGLAAHAPWYYYPFLVIFFLGFILIPGAIGGLCCLLLINYIPRRRKQLLILIAGVAVVVIGWFIHRNLTSKRPQMWNREELTEFLDRFTFARSFFLPSHWVSRGLQKAGQGAIGQASYYLALVWANGLFLYLVTAWAARRLYRRGLNRVATGGNLRKQHGGHWMDRLIAGCFPFVDPRTRLLIIKDFRTFRRDPQQWGQIVLFAGLMLLYVTNIRRVSDDFMGWRYLCNMSLLNLWVICLLTSIFTGRFIYPLLSLEGRKFWVLDLMPMRREQLLWGKFAFSAFGAVLLAGILVLVSDLMLMMPWYVVVCHLLAVIVVALGLSGLSVGLGACLANFKETDPFKVAVGFGGTVNLIISLLYLIVTLLFSTLPMHIGIMSAESQFKVVLPWIVISLGMAVAFAVGAAAIVIPLRMGLHALRKMEF